MLVFFILQLLFLPGCVKKRVFYPIPLTIDQTFMINVDVDGSFNIDLPFPTKELREKLQSQLSDFDTPNINNILLETVTFTITQTNDPNTVINGRADVTTSVQQPAMLFGINNLNMGQSLNQAQTVELGDTAVEMVKEALTKIFVLNQDEDLYFNVSGSVDPPQNNLTFELKIDLTINTIIDQCQDVFDFMGDDDQGCE